MVDKVERDENKKYRRRQQRAYLHDPFIRRYEETRTDQQTVYIADLVIYGRLYSVFRAIRVKGI